MVRTFEGNTESHFANFLNAVRSRKREELNAEILEGHQSTALCHIGNISWRLGKLAAAGELRDELTKLNLPSDALETLDRTTQHLRDNNVDLEKTKLTLASANCGAESASARRFLTTRKPTPFSRANTGSRLSCRPRDEGVGAKSPPLKRWASVDRP